MSRDGVVLFRYVMNREVVADILSVVRKRKTKASPTVEEKDKSTEKTDTYREKRLGKTLMIQGANHCFAML